MGGYTLKQRQKCNGSRAEIVETLAKIRIIRKTRSIEVFFAVKNEEEEKLPFDYYNHWSDDEILEDAAKYIFGKLHEFGYETIT
jgi:hypothetical protein